MTESLVRALSGEPIRVGTKNRAKCEAVRIALACLLRPTDAGETSPGARLPDDLAIVPVAVESGVAEQPVGYEEIVAGARQRARAAFGSGACALAVGIEDGLVRLPDGLGADALPEAMSPYNVGCAWLTDGTREAAGFSSGFAYPSQCSAPAALDRMPIGDLFDALWRAQRNEPDGASSGPREGNIGKLTGGRLTRADYGSHAVLCALVRFLHKDLYD